MNFKTTIVLLVALAVAGVLVFFTSDRPDEPPAPTPQRLFSLSADDVTQVSVIAGKRTIVAQRENGAWRLSKPVQAPADENTIDSIVRQVVNLESQGQVRLDDENRRRIGLDEPVLRVQLSTAGGEQAQLSVGQRSGTGDGVYVQKDDASEAHLVQADLYATLDRPAAEFRTRQLMEIRSTDVQEAQIRHSKGEITLQKQDGSWRMTQPSEMPAETTEVTDLLRDVTGARVQRFVAEDAAEAAKYQLDKPLAMVTLTAQTAPPPGTTQPATTQPTTVTLRLGRYDDVMQKNVYAMIGESGPIVTVPASVFDALQVSPLDLRSREVLSIEPRQVQRIAINFEPAPATQPTATAPSPRQVEIVRAEPATQPATTRAEAEPDQAATAEAEADGDPAPAAAPAPPWRIVSEPSGPADGEQVDRLLSSLNPLRASAYLESVPTPVINDRYTLTLETRGDADAPAQTHVIQIEEADQASQPIGRYNDLLFEPPRALLDHLKADYAASAEESGDETGDAPEAPQPPTVFQEQP